jgi:hypothetical protein
MADDKILVDKAEYAKLWMWQAAAPWFVKNTVTISKDEYNNLLSENARLAAVQDQLEQLKSDVLLLDDEPEHDACEECGRYSVITNDFRMRSDFKNNGVPCDQAHFVCHECMEQYQTVIEVDGFECPTCWRADVLTRS